ncbi:Glycosyltransferase [Pantoea sp. AS-PWVM4]|uniref:glycosyltransferase n=1 Tax=Pantoea sp. AS-PWVM4 TaxID=1332069 RepID=UPI0003AC7892|nr:glycosyltransferase family 4 protein [Pantoea sp. AS-PWVM4]ERK09464.1 Glycosyltransferase [Pantoea sp. AS-PWVM4]
MRALFLTTVLPYRASSGGESVSKNLICKMSELGVYVDVVGYKRMHESTEKKEENFHSVDERIIETSGNKFQTIKWLISAIVSNKSFSVIKYYGKSYINKVNELIKKNSYNYVFIDHTQILWMLDYLPPNLKVIFISHNVESDLYFDLYKKSQGVIKKTIFLREAKSISRLENKAISKCNQVWSLSSDDLMFYKNQIKVKDEKLVLFEPLPMIEPRKKSLRTHINCDISIIGTWTWSANSKGLEWFFDQVYPKLPDDITIHVAGKGAQWLKDKYSNVSYLGFVQSAEEFMLSSRMVVIPSVSGAGVQIKTLDAITLGVPTIASRFALRGIEDAPSYVKSAADHEAMIKEVKNALSSQLGDEELINCSVEASNWYERKNTRLKKIILNSLS